MITVLIADDHTLVAEGLRHVVEAEPGLRVIGHAANGEEAVRLCERLRPNVVVMDSAMPLMNGLEATEAISRSCAQARVIMLSMYGDNVHVLRAIRAGAVGYLVKKSVGKELTEAIRRVHLGRTYFSNDLAEIVLNDVIESRGDPMTRLSTRERQVLQLVAEGLTSSEIAARLHLSPKTVETYRSRLMSKLGLHDLAGLIKFAIREGVISTD